MKQRTILMLTGLLVLSSNAWADWLPKLPSTLPTIEQWLHQQCLSRMAQYPKLKLSSHEQTATCHCMAKQAKKEIQRRDMVHLLHMSNAQLEQQYGERAKAAFAACQTLTAKQ